MDRKQFKITPECGGTTVQGGLGKALPQTLQIVAHPQGPLAFDAQAMHQHGIVACSAVGAFQMSDKIIHAAMLVSALAGGFNSPSHRATTAAARQFPTRLMAVRPTSRN